MVGGYISVLIESVPESATVALPQQMSQPSVPTEGATKEESNMEVNCNGNTSPPVSETSLECQENGTNQSAEELLDQQNANQVDDKTETLDKVCKKDNLERCNGPSEDPEPQQQQQPPVSLSSDVVTSEMNDAVKFEKKDEDMDTQGENKTRGEDEENSQNG